MKKEVRNRHMKKALDVLEKAIEMLMAVLIGVFTLLILVQVVSRYVFNNTVTWSEQAARYLFIWLIFLGMPILYRHGEHVGFTMVVERFPRKVQDIIGIVIHILVLVFCVFWLVQAFKFCGQVSGKKMVGLGLPQIYVHACQPTGAILMIIYVLESIVNNFRDLFRKEEAK